MSRFIHDLGSEDLIHVFWRNKEGTKQSLRLWAYKLKNAEINWKIKPGSGWMDEEYNYCLERYSKELQNYRHYSLLVELVLKKRGHSTDFAPSTPVKTGPSFSYICDAICTLPLANTS